MQIFDHEELGWKSRAVYTSGALTYSKDIVKYQIPHWKKILTDDDVIATCGKVCDIPIKFRPRTVIQYLHSYPYYNAVERVQQIAKGIRCSNITFLTAYKKFEETLKLYGINAVYVPMAIDVKEIEKYKQEPTKDGFIWYGNVIMDKIGTFNAIKSECHARKIPFDYISYGLFNDKIKVNQSEALNIIAQYRYGIGVGRCAQEMFALGLKVMIAGKAVGGLITNEQEYEKQLATNMNGRITTYSKDIYRNLTDIDKSVIMVNDITGMNHAEIYEKVSRTNS